MEMLRSKRIWYAHEMINLLYKFIERVDDYAREVKYSSSDEMDPLEVDLELFEVRGMFKVIEKEYDGTYNGDRVLNSFGSFIAGYPDESDESPVIQEITSSLDVDEEEIAEEFDDFEL